jgi:7,8-dihydro-6-hydroxymethylpterin dimethyltransferase
MRATRPYTYLGTVQGMCRECGALVPARVLEENGAVYQERLCHRCGATRARIADDVSWYLKRSAETVQCKPSRLAGTPVKAGCPNDCGPCTAHANACHLPVFSVTNACNMDCPICFTYNRADRKYFMSRAELRDLLDKLIARVGPVDLINITGGEPTLHPDILDLLQECKRPEIGRVTMNSNGLRLAADEDFCRALAELGVYVVLSFDTFQAPRALRIHGRDVVAEKRHALDNLQRFGIGTTLLNVMIRGVNDDEIGDVIRLAKANSVVRSVTVQTMTFTGKGGRDFQPREAMPLDAAARGVEQALKGEIREADFFPHSSAHPLCYSIAYYLKDGERLRSLTDFFSREELRGMVARSYLLQPGQQGQDLFRQAIDRLWAEGDAENHLPALRALVDRMYPPGKNLSASERQSAAEQSLLAIYLHSHMDEDTLDLARLAVCPDQVPDPEGRLISACAYNLFYRQKDPRFWDKPKVPQAGAPLPARQPRGALPPGAPAPPPAPSELVRPHFLTPSFVPASKETSRVMPAVPAPEPHPGWYSRGYLPHWDHPGMIQSVNFRLHDALPREVIDKWKAELGLPFGQRAVSVSGERELQCASAGRTAPTNHPPVDPREIELFRRVAEYEDQGHGACWLRDERIAQLVENALLHCDGQHYRLLSWCVMPNHVHVLFETKSGFPLADVVESWKSVSAHRANRVLGRKGEFWQREYRDRYIRNAEHFIIAIRYIEQNPVKAGLAKLASDWRFSSARFKSGGSTPRATVAPQENPDAGEGAGAPNQ